MVALDRDVMEVFGRLVGSRQILQVTEVRWEVVSLWTWQLNFSFVIKLNIALILMEFQVISDLKSIRLSDISRCVRPRSRYITWLGLSNDPISTHSSSRFLKLRHARIFSL